MSGSRKHRIETVVSRQDMAAWLQGVAGAVAAGELPFEGGTLNLENCRSLKISLKERGADMRARISVRLARETDRGAQGGEAATAVAPESLPRYNSLKKHMKQTFRTIGQALAAGQLPLDLEARSFIVDARLMVTYAGKGDDFYGAFLGKVEAFEAALAAGDAAAANALHQELAALKRECHRRHA